ncbi:MAG: IS110 family transposase, partial [Alphaproteobacteria bacterium]
MFYGLDVHKEFIQVCRLSPDGRRRREFRIAATREALEAFARRLTPDDQVALEATFHSWAIHAILAPAAGRVVVVNALQVKAIAHAKIKTDKVDARTLAQLLRVDFLPAVQLPDDEAWALRQLISHRRLLIKQQTAAKNTIRSLLNRRLLALPEGVTPFARKTRRWMHELALPATERFVLDNALELLEQIEARVAAADAQLRAHASITESAKLLMTIPGINITVAIALLAAIGDIQRFPTPPKLAAYFGLVPKVRQSAGRCHHGTITKAGPCTARSLAIEAAQVLARSSSPLTATYWRVRHKRGHNAAVTALARKLITIVWHLLHKREPYRYAPAARTRDKLRRVTPERTRTTRVPHSLDRVYAEAGLPPLPPPSP